MFALVGSGYWIVAVCSVKDVCVAGIKDSQSTAFEWMAIAWQRLRKPIFIPASLTLLTLDVWEL